MKWKSTVPAFTFGVTFLAIVALAGLAWTTFTYRPIYRQTAPAGRALPRLVPQVVFVIIDGLRYDVAQQMPCLTQIASSGASARSVPVLPSMSQPAWTALVSGATPEISGAVLTNAAYAEIKPIAVEDLFGTAHLAGLRTALAGQLWWSKMVPSAGLDVAHFVAEFDSPGDAQAMAAGITFAQRPDLNLVLIYMGDYDEIAHDYGGLSPEARRSAQRSDDQLCALRQAVDLNKTVVIVTADHGHLVLGGHGGDEPDVMQVPFVMAGPRVRPGRYETVNEVDIPATVAALLGTGLPRSGQGRVLSEMLQVSEAERAQQQVALTVQQVNLVDDYLRALGAAPLSPTLQDRAAQLEGLLGQGDYAGTERAAAAVLGETAQQVQMARAVRVTQARALRGVLFLACAAALGVLFWRLRRRTGWLPLVLAVAATALYHLIYVATGHTYTMSTLSSVGEPMKLVLTLAGSALVALLAWPVLRRLAPRLFREGVGPAYLACLVSVLFLLGLLAAAASGALGRWNFVVSRLNFLALVSFAQAAVTGILGLLLTLLAASFRRLTQSNHPKG